MTDIPAGGATLRRVRASASDVALARQAVVEVHGRDVTGDEALAIFLADPSRYLLVAVVGDEVVGSLNGYALVHPHRPEPQFLLYEIDVKEGWRRRGIASGLVDAFAEEARKAGAFSVWVVTDEQNAPAMGLYAKCGFTHGDAADVVFSRELIP